MTICEWFSPIFSSSFPQVCLRNVQGPGPVCVIQHCIPGYFWARETSSCCGRASQWLGGAADTAVGRYIWGWVKSLVPSERRKPAGKWRFIGLELKIRGFDPRPHGKVRKVMIDHPFGNGILSGSMGYEWDIARSRCTKRDGKWPLK